MRHPNSQRPQSRHGGVDRVMLLALLLLACSGLFWPNVASAQAICGPYNLHVDHGGSVTVTYCNNQSFSGFQGLHAGEEPQHGTVTIDRIANPDTFTYTHNGGADNATSDHFQVEDYDANPIDVTVTIGPPSAITISPASLNLQAGTEINQQLTASGGAGPYTYTQTSGTLPTGLSLSQEGVISGTPTARRTYSFTVEAKDSTGATGAKAYTGTVTAADLGLTPTNVSGFVGESLSVTFAPTGGVAPYSLSLDPTSDPLPSGLELNGLTLSGIPDAAGDYTLIVELDESSTGNGVNFELFTITISIKNPPPSLTGISPATGPEAGGTSVILTGTNLAGATAVTFGGRPASITANTGSSITATAPPGAGTVDVQVTTPDGSDTLAGAFAYQPPPTLAINDVTLSEGNSGTTTFTFAVSLSRPADAGRVSFDIATADGSANAGSDYTAKSVTGLNIPEGSSSYNFAVDVTGDTEFEQDETFSVEVTNVDGATVLDGQGLGTIINDDIAAPTLTDISPNTGTAAGGTTVTITGTNLTSATAITFGGIRASSFTVNSATQITAVTPAGSGTVDVEVTTSGGNATLSHVFTYEPATPTLTSISPATGSTNGGTAVTITGTNLTSATAVTFGGVAATSFTVNSATQVTAVTPAGTGRIDVVVVTPAGSATLSDAFTYQASAPTLTNVSPASGPAGGGTTVTLTGTNLAGATDVSFGGVAATSVSVVDASHVTAVAPPGAGMVDIVVFTPDGNATLSNAFTYQPGVPTLTGISPASGAELGGTVVTLAGTNLTDAIRVNIGGTAATDVTVVDATHVTAVTPAGTGTVDVVVYTPRGTATLPGAFTYEVAAPTLTNISPATGPAAGGTVVTITGTNLTGATSVTFGGSAATNIAVNGATQITASTPAGTGSVDVAVSTPGGDATLARAFTYQTAISSDATLAGLMTSAGQIEPGFNPATTSYSVDVGNDVEIFSVTPTAAESHATISVNGRSVASGTSSQPITLNVGSQPVHVVVTAQDGTTKWTYTLTVTRAAITRPDPSLDPEVIGLLNAQANAASRFAQNQIQNFNGRLEQLHHESDRRASSMNIRFGYTPSNSPAEAERQLLEMDGGDPFASTGSRTDRATSALAYGPDGKSLPGTDAAAPNSPSFVNPDFGPFAIWSGGFVNFGDRDDGHLDLDYTMVGVSGGIDYRFSPRFVGGFGLGYGRDRTDVGSNGTQSRAQAFSAAIYGSYNPVKNAFIDGLVGGSRLDFESRRFITANGEFATGDRSGKQIFASLTGAYEFRDETWLLSPYGRFEFSRSWLDGFTESGGDIYGLKYGNQTIDTLSGVLGIRASYSIPTDWGVLTPGIRAEFTHDFEGSSRATLGYTDLGGLPYSIDLDPTDENYATLGLSLDLQFVNDWDLGLDYRTSFGGSSSQDHAFGAKLSARF